MNATVSPEMKQYRTVAAVVRTVVLLGVLAGLAAIGARSPAPSIAATNCAYAAAPTGTLSDATLELSATCGGALESVEPATAEAKFGVPDAGSALDPRAQPEAQPATF